MGEVYCGCGMCDFLIGEIYGFGFRVNVNGLCVDCGLLGMGIGGVG